MEVRIINIIDKIRNEELTCKEAESKLLLLYSVGKRCFYLTAKEWGYSSYEQNACGIEKYALPNFIEEFELWYQEQNFNVC
jgi:hypothetical protein